MVQGQVEAAEELKNWRENLFQVSDLQKFHPGWFNLREESD